MHSRRLRPRFHLDLPFEGKEAIERLQVELDKPGCPCVGMVADLQLHFDLRMPKPERHLWSPALGGYFEDREEGGSTLHGLIGPNPSTWTAVAFSYLALFTGILFLLTLGGVQIFLENNPWGLYTAGFLALLVGVNWLIAQAGQKMAADQTALLRHFLEDIFQVGPEEHRRTDEDPYHP